MCPVYDVVHIGFKVVVSTSDKEVNQGEDHKDSGKDNWMKDMKQPPWSVWYEHIKHINHSYQKVAREVLKVQEVSVRGVEGDPVHQGDHQGQGAVDITEHPE